MFRINPLSKSQPTSLSSKLAKPSKAKRLHPFTDDEVRAKAHQVWLKRGGGEGGEEEDWQQAIKALKWERSPLGRTQKLFQLAWSVDNPKDAIEVIKMGISALGLIATISAGVGLYLTYQNGREQQRIALREQQLNTERLMTDRFAKAVEQLGSKESNVRIGAIYSLERIAKDSPRDHWTVMEVLTAYVRERSRVPQGWIDIPPNQRKQLPDVTTDVQSALTVIRRRKEENNSGSARLDLGGTNLRGADLTFANLSGADLYRANLENADLTGVNLNVANLDRVNLRGADLISADFVGSSLSYTDLRTANLRIADLRYAYLKGANLFEANLNEANLTNARDWTDEQLGEAFLCLTKLPEGSKLDRYRDCKALGITPRPAPPSPKP